MYLACPGWLESFQTEGFIQETRVEGRKRSYQITQRGRLRLEEEVRRLRRQTEDYMRFAPRAGGSYSSLSSASPSGGTGGT